jgi:hypothetical protein
MNFRVLCFLLLPGMGRAQDQAPLVGPMTREVTIRLRTEAEPLRVDALLTTPVPLPPHDGYRKAQRALERELGRRKGRERVPVPGPRPWGTVPMSAW